MKTCFLTFALVSLVCAVPVAGQLDQDPDGLGVYADLEGMVNSVMAPPSIVEVHLLATNITGPEIKIWAANLRFTGNIMIGNLNTPYVSDIVVSTPDDRTVEYIVMEDQTPFPGTVLQAAPIIHLATLEIWVFDTDPIDIYLRHIDHLFDDPSGYTWYPEVGDAPIIEFHPSSGSWDLPVMRINGEAPVPVEARSWSDLKTVFR